MIVYTAMGTVDLKEYNKSESYLEVGKERSMGIVVYFTHKELSCSISSDRGTVLPNNLVPFL